MKYMANACGFEKLLPENDEINMMIVDAEHTEKIGCIFLFLKKNMAS